LTDIVAVQRAFGAYRGDKNESYAPHVDAFLAGQALGAVRRFREGG